MLFPAWVALAYLLGAMPFAVWFGKLVYGVDPRAFGDGNPGAANAFKAAGKGLGIAVILADFFKAFLPVLIARYGLNLSSEQLFWVALAPTVGHAFSIFLRFRGGRALVTLFGVWSGLTLWVVPTVMGLSAFIFTRLFTRHEAASLAMLLGAGGFLLVTGAEGWMLALLAAQMLLLAIKIGPAKLRLTLPASHLSKSHSSGGHPS